MIRYQVLAQKGRKEVIAPDENVASLSIRLYVPWGGQANLNRILNFDFLYVLHAVLVGRLM